MKRHTALVSLAAAVFAGALATACGGHRTEPAATAAPRAVQVAPVGSASLSDTVRAQGFLTPKDEARLSFKVGGIVESIRVEEGARVVAGQLLAVLKQAEIGAALEQARQSAAKTERDFKRGKALYADGVATEEQLQDLTTAFRVASAALKSVEFNASYTRIVAPANGVVLRKLAEANELVQSGQPVLAVGGDGRGWIVRVGLADRDAVRVRIGNHAELQFDAWPAVAFQGRVSNIASAADPATGTFTVEVQVDPAGAPFVQGLVAKVVVSPPDAARTAVVPVQALVEANGSEASVFVLDAGRRAVRRTTIRIGRIAGGQVEVLDGLTPGTEVVIDGAAFLENGDSVRIAAEHAAPPPSAG